MTRAFSLLITLALISLFAFIGIFIVEISNISSNIDKKNLLYSQANLHMKSTKNLISNLDIYDENKNCIDSLNIKNEAFDINLYFSYITKKNDCKELISNDFDDSNTSGVAIIDIYIKSKTSDIRLHERINKKLE